MFKPIFFGVFFFFALIFALVGMLKGRKYKWQFSAARIILLVGATLVATLISMLIGWIAGGALLNSLESLFGASSGIVELLKLVPSAKDVFRAVLAMIIAPLVFVLVFLIVRPLINLFTNLLCKALMKIGNKPEEAVAVSAETETLDDAVEAAETAEGQETVAVESAPKKKKNKFDKYRSDKKFDPLGAVLGALCSFLVLVVLLVPMVGAVTFGNSVVQIAVKPQDETTEMVCEISDAAANNLGAKTVNFCGGKLVWRLLTSYPVQGEWTSAPRETAFLTETADAVISISDKNISRKEAADTLRGVSKSFDKSVMIPTMLSDLLSSASENWSEGKDFCGIKAPSIGKNVDPIVKDFFGAMKNANAETIREDVGTIVDIVALMVERDAMSALDGEDGALALFEDEELVSGILLEFLENDRMSTMVGSMTNFGLSMLGAELDVAESTDGMYDSFITGMYDAYRSTNNARDIVALELLSANVAKVYDDHGIVISDGVSTCIALDMMDSIQYGSREEISAFFAVSDSNTEFVVANGIPVSLLGTSEKKPVNSASTTIVSSIVKDMDEEITRNELRALIADEFAKTNISFTDEELARISDSVARKMYSDIKDGNFKYDDAVISNNNDIDNKTIKITGDDLVVKMSKITDKKKEADAIANVFATTLDTVDLLSDKNTKTGEVVALFGDVLDSFKESEIIGDDVTENVLVSIFQSKKVRGEIGFTLVQATSIADKINNGAASDGTYSTLLRSLGDTVEIISVASGSGDSTEVVEKLIGSITPTSAEVLQSLSTPETVKNYGVSDESSVPVSDMMSDMFGNMAKAKEEGRLNDEAYEKEALAVSDMMSIAMSAGSSNAQSTFGAGSATNITATEFVDRATDSVIISETFVNATYGDDDEVNVDPLLSNRELSDAEKDELVGALDTKWQAQVDSSEDAEANEEYQKVLTSVASVVNVGIEFTANGIVAAE